MKIASKTQASIGMAISFVLIFLLVKQVDLSFIFQELLQTNLYWLSVSLVLFWAEILVRILRWKRILIGVNSTVHYSLISNSFCIGSATNNIFPFRMGDILRAHLVGIQCNTSRYSIMGTIVLEKLIDVAAVLLLTSWGAFGVLSQIGAMSNVIFILVVGGMSVIMLGIVYFIAKNKFISNKLMILINERFGYFKKGFGILLKPKNLSLVIVETILIWTFNSLAIWAIIKSLGVSLSVSEVLLLEGVSGLAAAIPSAPAGIGTLQYAFLLVFGVMQLDKSVGVAASLLVQGVLLGSIVLVGLLIFVFDSKSRLALRQIRHE